MIPLCSVPISEGNSIVLLEVKDLSVVYGQAKAIENASFSVTKGEIVAMLGANGAGKSTALKVVSGILTAAGGKITTGDVRYAAESILGFRPDQLVAKGVSLVPEGRRVFTSMTVRENLEMGGFLLNDSKKTRIRIEHILTIFGPLRDRLSQKAGTLSGGEQQMLSLGRALILEPTLLLVDEPSLGLSPNFIEIVFEKLQEINHAGTSILLVEQNARMALEICSRAYVFETGRIALDGTRGDLLTDPSIKEIFLGGE
jgi:branched-chain amino acid transport system ATP-binding protein